MNEPVVRYSPDPCEHGDLTKDPAGAFVAAADFDAIITCPNSAISRRSDPTNGGRLAHWNSQARMTRTVQSFQVEQMVIDRAAFRLLSNTGV